MSVVTRATLCVRRCSYASRQQWLLVLSFALRRHGGAPNKSCKQREQTCAYERSSTTYRRSLTFCILAARSGATRPPPPARQAARRAPRRPPTMVRPSLSATLTAHNAPRATRRPVGLLARSAVALPPRPSISSATRCPDRPTRRPPPPTGLGPSARTPTTNRSPSNGPLHLPLGWASNSQSSVARPGSSPSRRNRPRLLFGLLGGLVPPAAVTV